MLRLRLAPAAFIPAVLALVVAAFSLGDRPRPTTTTASADAFDAVRAFGAGEPAPRDSLRELAAAFPDRRPGSAGDGAVADRVAAAFRAAGLQVGDGTRTGGTAVGRVGLRTVTGTRPGSSGRTVVVLADRSSLRRGDAAALSGTAAIIELARVFRTVQSTTGVEDEAGDRAVGRDMTRTLVLVSTSGLSAGGGGAAGIDAVRRLGGDRIDAVLVLGDLAGARVAKPWVVPWSNGRHVTPSRLVRTVEAAVRAEVGDPPGGSRAAAQWLRRAVPLSLGEQGEPVRRGLPAVMLGVSGERGPRPGTAVLQERMSSFGRATLRTITAIDAASVSGDGTDEAAAFERSPEGIVTYRRLLPEWAIRLLLGALVVPAIAMAIGALVRARAARMPLLPWLLWTGLAALPPLVGWASLRVLAVVGALPAGPAPADPRQVPVGLWGVVAIVVAVLLTGGVGAWLAPRAARTLSLPRDRTEGAGAAVLAAVAAVVAVVTWVRAPYTLALLLPALYLWPAVQPLGRRWFGVPAALCLLVALVPALLAARGLAGVLDLSAGPLAWLAVLAMGGGPLTPGTAVALAGALAVQAGWTVWLVHALLGPRRSERAHGHGPASSADPADLGASSFPVLAPIEHG